MPGALWGSWASPYVMAPVYYAHYAQNVEWPGASSSHGAGGNFALCDGSVRTIATTIAVGGQGGAVGDAYGRYGNVWSAIHLIQGIPDKSNPNF
jgi:prepilin-type processing-associated H-X9-DG protein